MGQTAPYWALKNEVSRVKNKKKTGRPRRIDKKKLFNMLRQGKSQTQCAKEFGVTPSAVNQVAKTLNLAIAKNTNLETGAVLVEEGLDSMRQLRRINDETNKLIDLLSAWVDGDPAAIKTLEKQHRLGRIGKGKGVATLSFKDPKEILLKTLAECRAQVRLSLDIAQSLHNLKSVEEFQRTVIEIIGELNPEARNEIIRKLQHRRALRGSVRIA